MIQLHPETLNRNGKEFVLLPREEFMRVQELLEDALDLLELRKAKMEDDRAEPDVSIEHVMKRFGVK